jgi:hypothetical protein
MSMICARAITRVDACAVVADVQEHLHVNSPWQYKLAAIYYEPTVTAAIENIVAKELLRSAP